MEYKDFGGLKFSPATLGELQHRLAKGHDLFARKGLELPLSTGSLTLDRATGLGGLPRGQLVLLTGTIFERSRVLALAMVSAVQRQGGRVVVIDVSDRLWSPLRQHSAIGEKNLAFLKAESPFDAVDVARTLVESQQVDLVLLGPLAGRGLKQKLQALERATQGGRAAVVALDSGGPSASTTISTKGLRKTLEDLVGMKIGTRSVSGGSVLGGLLEGSRLKVDVIREGLRPSLSTTIDLDPEGTVSKTGDLLEYGLAEGYIKRRGSMYELAGGETLGRGRQAAKRTLNAEADVGLALESMAERGMEELQKSQAETPFPKPVRKAKELSEKPHGSDLIPDGQREDSEGGLGQDEDGTVVLTDSSKGARYSVEEEAKELGTELSETHLGPETTSREPAKEARPKPPSRFLNTWFEGPVEPLLPLVVGEWVDFKFQIGQRRVKLPGGGAAPFVEPDFGSHSGADLLVSLYSSDFHIENRNHTFWLAKVGNAPVQATHVSPLHAGRCQLRLVISLRQELEILQSMIVEVEAIEAVEAVETEERS